jgi:hypothetical protein
MAEALSPAFDSELRALQQLERRRHALYAYCARQALPDWRVGVRGGVTLQAIPRQLTPLDPDTRLPDLRLGVASLGVITELAPWMTFQVMGRRSLKDAPPMAEGSAALHVGGGVGGKWYGVESTFHVGIDASTTWRNVLGKSEPYEVSALVAPSLAIKLGQLGALGLSGGYIFGGPRSGWTASAAVVWDMDRFFLQEPPPLSSDQ